MGVIDDLIAGALPGIAGRAKVVISPYPFGVSDADNIRVVSANSLAGVTIEIHGRTAAGGLESKPFRFVHVPNTDRSKKTEDFVLGAGLVTNLSVFATAGTPVIGQTFVMVQLIRSIGGTAFVMGTLLAGYVTSTQSLGWPGSPIQDSIDGGGYFYEPVFNVAGPQTTLAWLVPTGARWRIHGGACFLTTTAAAGNRQLFISHRTPANHNVAQNFAPAVVPASSQVQHVWSPGIQGSEKNIAGVVQNMAQPDPLTIIAGGTFRADILNALAGDDLTLLTYQLFVEEWLEVS